MTKVNFIITVAVAALTISLWVLINQPEQEPAWPERIQGFSFSPMRAHQSPLTGVFPTEQEIDDDLALLAGKTHAVRTYTVEHEALTRIPELAARHGINVAMGAWLDNRLEKNEQEIETLINVVRASRNVVRVMVGNEVVLRADIPTEDLVAYIDRVRAALEVPVSTAEPWHVWMKHPELVEHVDYIAVHMLPYWEGIDVDLAVDYVVDRYNELKRAYPGKRIVITEVGWPSNGRTRHDAVASVSNQAVFLRRFLARAKTEKYTYYVMEAFDQPWKRHTEGAVGAYWGVYNVDREAKFPFSEPILPVPQWYILAGISILVAAITFGVLLVDSRTLRHTGRSFLAIIAYAAATAAVWVIYDYLHQYLTIGTVIVGILLVIGMIGVIVVLLTEAHEWAEAHWFTERRRAFKPVRVASEALPMVSIHVPAYNEPPAMLIETLDALARLDYPNYEVIVIDNNTKDPQVWQPVQAHCARLGPRFRFFHVDPLSGFKSGALNYALDQTAPEAGIIAVIDSDYVVDDAWLRDLVPQFSNSKVAIVQAPQDYRDNGENAFKAMCHAEYRGFFFIGMVTRNERNAIIQHGTMTMTRRDVLEEVGRWDERSITEDAELGLRVFEKGYEAIYIPRSYGKGLMPDTFNDYKNQRFRWAYGAMQILRAHRGKLLGNAQSRLSGGQRYHFLAGWLPWIADGINLVFNMAALIWSAALVIAPTKIDPPLAVFSLLPLTFFSFKVGKLIYLYRTQVDATLGQTVSAAFAGLALSHTIAKAVLSGLFTTGRPFFRTPKFARGLRLFKALASAREEALVMLALWTAVVGIAMSQGTDSRDLLLWMIVLAVQSLPYFATVAVSLLSGLPKAPASLLGETKDSGSHPTPAS